ncbi:MAG: hypothetical protein ABJF10_05195 [Chthoniobacter sp.]|uniref:hypothetical protein n=1 Tax=Chthoniobacter sp. TaxID=2510640 RepID=UPI0032A9ED10
MRYIVFLLALGATAFGQVALPAVGKFPSTRVQVQIGVQEKAKGNDSYHKTQHIQPRFTFEGASGMLPIPAGEAVMLIISYDTRAKFVENRDSYKVLSTETLPVPAVPTGARRTLSFAPSDVSFDGYRDNSNVGGEAYKYYIFALRDTESKTLIDFETNCLPLANFCKATPAKRDEMLGLTKGTKFPMAFK